MHNRITYKGTVYKLDSSDLIRSQSAMYMKLKYFQSVFGLDGSFNFRRLWIVFTSNTELPVIREMKQELLRKNINRLTGVQKADTTIKRTYPFFHMGSADWAVTSTQQSQSNDDTRATLGLGAVLAGGEANVALNYYNKQPFTELQQFYQWRYVNNDMAALKQVAAGKIYSQSTSSLYAPVVGIQFSNAPTTNRRSYGTYTISDNAEPGWIVELYVNDILIDYKKTDASGFYSFNVPIMYGYTVVKLRFYGPYGEERTSQKYINVPFNFLPQHEFEYTASGGIVEDGKNSQFSRITANYGLSKRVTIGTGAEYLSSVTSGNTMPFVITSIRLASRLMVSGEYTYGVRARGILSYRLPSDAQIDLDHISYTPGQTAIYYNYLAENKATLSIPFHGIGYSFFTRFTVDDITVPLSRYTNTELAFTGSVRKVGFNFSSYASFAHGDNPYFYSLVSGSFMLPKKINFTAQVEYDYKAGKVAFMKYTFEKYLFTHAFVNVAFQEFFTGNTEYFKGNYNNFLVGFRYDLSFAKVAVSSLFGSNNTYNRVESASGSIVYDAKHNYLNANNRNNVGKGGVLIEPFLDLNCNGKHDPGEPMATGLKLRINGGRVAYQKDTTIRVFDLESYADYIIELIPNSFDNIAWQLKVRSVKVTVSANNFTRIEVPVYVMGEVSGDVSVVNKQGNVVKGQGQITVLIYNSDSILVAHAQTETDGFFSYIGLAPGKYYCTPDPEQMKKLHMTSAPIPFTIRSLSSNDGDFVTDLEFKLHPIEQ